MPDTSRLQPTRDLTAGRELAAESNNAASRAGTTLRLARVHDRIAQGPADVVVRRLFGAGLHLQAALGLIGEHRAAPEICHAVDELDQAIRDIRDTSLIAGQPAGCPDNTSLVSRSAAIGVPVNIGPHRPAE